VKQREQRTHCSHTTTTPNRAGMDWDTYLNQFNIWPENYQLFRYSLHFMYFRLFLLLVYVTCTSAVSIFIIYTLLFYNCKLYYILHSIILVSCLLYLLGHSCLCDVLILTCFNIQLTVARCQRCETYICVCVCTCAHVCYVNKTKTLKQNIKFCIYIYRNEWRTKQTFSFIYMYNLSRTITTQGPEIRQETKCNKFWASSHSLHFFYK
jgi:hypothetical protein